MNWWHNRYPSHHIYASRTRVRAAMGGLGRFMRPCLPAAVTLLFWGLLAPCGGSAQSTTSGKPPADLQSNASDEGAQAATTGMKTGGAHAAIYDQQLRPITAGGFVKNGPVILKDIARQAGLTSWQHQMGTPDKRFIIDTIGSGVGLVDYDNDGWLDINVMDGPPALLLDVSPDKHNWIDIKLVGGPKSPRDAIGTTVYLTANHMRQRGDVISGGSYASNNDPRLHFGLGDSTLIDDVEVHWPSGAKERFSISQIDRIITLAEGSGTEF